MEENLFVEVAIKFPDSKEKKTGLFKLPWDMENVNLITDIVAFSEMVKAWIITVTTPGD